MALEAALVGALATTAERGRPVRGWGHATVAVQVATTMLMAHTWEAASMVAGGVAMMNA
jgi:hypothetical protein